jgi:hypothetical protein
VTSQTPIIACAADPKHLGGYFETLKRQVTSRGLTFIVQVISDFSWAALVEWELEFCRRHSGERVCFVDTEDFLMQGSVEDLEAAMAAPLIFHAEARCWPEAWKADLYPPCDTPFRFVNGTGPAGNCDAIAEAIELGLANFPIRGRESSIFADNDQRFYTDIYLTERGVVDSNCRLSVQLNAVGAGDYRIINGGLYLNATGTRPVFLHLNGASRHAAADFVRRLRMD